MTRCHTETEVANQVCNLVHGILTPGQSALALDPQGHALSKVNTRVLFGSHSLGSAVKGAAVEAYALRTRPSRRISMPSLKDDRYPQLHVLRSIRLQWQCSLDREVEARFSTASQALGRLCNRVLNQHNERLSTKLKVHNAAVIPSLLYGCESWTPYRRHIKKLANVHMHALRSALGIRWQDHVTNIEVMNSA